MLILVLLLDTLLSYNNLILFNLTKLIFNQIIDSGSNNFFLAHSPILQPFSKLIKVN